jgi:hypothetical protein
MEGKTTTFLRELKKSIREKLNEAIKDQAVYEQTLNFYMNRNTGLDLKEHNAKIRLDGKLEVISKMIKTLEELLQYVLCWNK